MNAVTGINQPAQDLNSLTAQASILTTEDKIKSGDPFQVWEKDLGNTIFNPPVLNEDGTIYVSNTHHLFAIDGKTKEVKQKDNLFLFDFSDNVHCINSKTGKNKWNHKIYEGIAKDEDSGPIYCFSEEDKTLFIATKDSYILKFDAQTGKFITKFKTSSPVMTSIISSTKENTLFFGNSSGFYSIDAKAGEVLWENKDAELLPPNLYPAGYYLSKKGILYVGNSSYSAGIANSIVSIDVKDGKTVWKNSLFQTDKLARSNSPFAASPDEKTIYALQGQFFPGIDAYDADTGKNTWHAKMGKTLSASYEAFKGGFKLQISSDGKYLFLSHENLIAVFKPPKQVPVFIKEFKDKQFKGHILLSEKEGLFFICHAGGKISAFSYENHLENALEARKAEAKKPLPGIKKNPNFVEIGKVRIPINKFV